MNKNVDDKMDLRRRNLQIYKDRSAAGEWQSIAKQIGVSASDLSQRLSGHRPFTEKFARQVENRLKLTPGWLDIEQSGRPSQIGDEGLLSRVISITNAAVKASGKSFKDDTALYGQFVELIYEDSKERGMPTESWLTRLVKLILD